MNRTNDRPISQTYKNDNITQNNNIIGTDQQTFVSDWI